MPQKPVCRTFNNDNIRIARIPFHIPLIHQPDGAAFCRMLRNYLPEIPNAQDAGRRPPHRRQVQRLRNVAAAVAQQRRRLPAVEDMIAVASAGCAASGMKLRRRICRRQYSDCRRQIVVQRPPEYSASIRPGSSEIHYLAVGVGTGVGAAGRPQAYPFAGKLADGSFQLALYSRSVGLPLETGVTRAVIGNGKGDTAHPASHRQSVVVVVMSIRGWFGYGGSSPVRHGV